MDEAFAKLFAQHQRPLYALVRSFCPRPQDADDVFQETFVVAWRKREEFEPGSNFLAWAASIARYEALAHARREGRANTCFDEALMATLADHAVEMGGNANARLEALRRCLEALTVRQRELIERRYASGGSVKALADQLGRSANSISVSLHAVRQKLLACIQQRLSGEAS